MFACLSTIHSTYYYYYLFMHPSWDQYRCGRIASMGNLSTTTNMLHFQCDTCHITATIVDTDVGRTAWADHMAIHVRPESFHVWSWTVAPLPLEEL